MLSRFIRINGAHIQRGFGEACRNFRQTQQRFLQRLLHEQQHTAYGRRYGFAAIKSEAEFRQAVPLVQSGELAVHVERILQGENQILTSDPVVWFARTSGTTANPKYIPYTAEGVRIAQRMLRLWLYRAQLAHPGLLQHGLLTLTAEAVEGYTASGLPYGSASGMSNRSMPGCFRQRLLIPHALVSVNDLQLRYYLLARLALAGRISFIAAPNALSIQKIAETIMLHREEIVRSIYNGWLSDTLQTTEQALTIGVPESGVRHLRPSRQRAKFLEQIFSRAEHFVPGDCWPELELIGCWLGGSIGMHAGGLPNYFPGVPRRDLGYMASEGIFTLPGRDEVTAGALTIPHNYFEFIPAEQEECSQPDILGVADLEVGRSYKVLITNRQGLYRCDMADIVRVHSLGRRGLPLVSFARKTASFLNIIGEKMHLNHFLEVVARLRREWLMDIRQFRIFGNQDLRRYELLFDLRSGGNVIADRDRLIRCIDSMLSECNIEYQSRRMSGRLNPPCLHLMSPMWEEGQSVKSSQGGRRDIQIKWQHLCDTLSQEDLSCILLSIQLSNL